MSRPKAIHAPVMHPPERRKARTSLEQLVDMRLGEYFADLGGAAPAPDMYRQVVSSVEKPLLKQVLHYARGNQLKAAAILGINRNTLRKKLDDLGVVEK